MGNSTTSLMLQEEEITGIVSETGCRFFSLDLMLYKRFYYFLGFINAFLNN